MSHLLQVTHGAHGAHSQQTNFTGDVLLIQLSCAFEYGTQFCPPPIAAALQNKVKFSQSPEREIINLAELKPLTMGVLQSPES